MIRRLGTAMAALALGATACAPWYRTDEIRAARAEDPKAMDAMLERCKPLAGDAAVACYMKALERNPHESRAKAGVVDALARAKRWPELRAFAEADAAQLAHPPPGLPTPTAEQSAAEASIRTAYVASFASEGLPALALQRDADFVKLAGGVPDAPTLDAAAATYPEAFAKLKEAAALAEAGQPSAALDRYAAWLADYGTPDSPLVQGWADQILAPCASLVADVVKHGDDALAAGNWIGALTSYAAAFRYMPASAFDASVADHMIEASSHVDDPSLLSPLAAEAAAGAESALAAKNVGAAIRGYRLAVGAAPYWAEARYNLAVLLGDVEMYDAAANQMNWFLALDPSSTLAAKATELEAHWRALAPPANP